jgi:hypothetical protein
MEMKWPVVPVSAMAVEGVDTDVFMGGVEPRSVGVVGFSS